MFKSKFRQLKSRKLILTTLLLKKKDRRQLEKLQRQIANYKFEWETFDYNVYFNLEHIQAEKQSNDIRKKKGYFRKQYNIHARMYRIWNLCLPIRKWNYALSTQYINLKKIKPLQQSFTALNYYLIQTKATKNFWIKQSPFLKFNYWLRTLLLLHRPKRFQNTMKQDWLDFILLLNFKRHRFFPSIRPLGKPSFVSLSLGIFRRFTRRSRAWTKTRMSYLLSASFLRKVLMYTQFTSMFLFINRVPKHLTAILHTIQSPALQIYEYPFLNFKHDLKANQLIYGDKGEVQFITPKKGDPLELPVLENRTTYQAQFPYIIFTNSKAYAPTRKKKRGSIKRQNLKKIILLNRIAEYL